MAQFGQKLAEVVADSVPCCVGIDPHEGQVPFDLTDDDGTWIAYYLTAWCRGVIDAVHEAGIRVVKPQSALFEQYGAHGIVALEGAVRYARSKGMIVILDAKRGDIGSTAKGYVRAAYRAMGANSVTLNPYLGPESLEPFKTYFAEQAKLKDAGEGGPGAWVLVRTSNSGAWDWQVGHAQTLGWSSISLRVAKWLNEANQGQDLGDFGAVIGATLEADEMAMWRKYMPNTWFLLPGYGAQGASAADCLAGFREDKTGGLIVSARGVLFPKKGDEDDDWKDGIYQRAKAFADDVASIL